MRTIAFSLKVAGKDEVTVTRVASTGYRFRGFLTLEGDTLVLEWNGTATVDEVGLVGARTLELSLPAESIILPLRELRELRLTGGWLRPAIQLTASALGEIRLVPSEEGGLVRCFIARRDRKEAAQLVSDALARRTLLEASPPPRLPETTPSGGVV